MNVASDKTQEIKRELAELNNCLKMSVDKAIKIGGLLIEQKEFVGHGNFLSWLKSNIDISDKTSEKYMSIFKHKNKIELNTNLQEAYKQIEQIEERERQLINQRDNAFIAVYKRTGKKPDGWDRRHDTIYANIKKNEERIQAEMEKRKRIAEEREKERLEQERLENERENRFENLKNRIFEATEESLRQSMEINNEKKQIKERLRLNSSTDNLSQEVVFEFLDDYLTSLNSDSRRIESGQNIIKYLRDKIVKLQRVGA